LAALFDAFIYLAHPWPFFLLVIGVTLGIMVGAIPGMTGAMLITLTLPLTFSFSNPADAMVLLVSMYVGSISGGLISATLLRMPGTPAAMMTTLDGYPLAASGQSGRALGLGVAASFAGGTISWVFLVLLSKPIADWSTRLGPFDFFSLSIMALMLISSVSGKSLLLGTFSGMLGVLASLPGVNPATGQLRLTGGFAELNDGLRLLPVLIGLFAVSQVIVDIVHLEQQGSPMAFARGGLWLGVRDWQRHAVNLVRSSLIGVWVGILPGVGANIGSVIAYSAAKGVSREPEKFGEGSEEGIVASESANNATVGGALIPLIALGIPGSVIDAILLGALIIHGLQPGPLLFRENPDVVYIIMSTTLVANIVMAAVMLVSVGKLARLMAFPRAYLVPLVLVFCIVGSFALNNRMFDVWVMLLFGFVGFALEKGKIPLSPFVIGFILAPIAEENLGAGLQSSGGSYAELATRPFSLLFLVIALALAIWPARRLWIKN
jgi:putative tricarboxylic transport membrane protein